MSVTINYLRPITAAITTPPTVAQSQRLSTVVAVLASNDGTTVSITITHDLNLPASDISQGFPTIVLTPLDTTATAAAFWVRASRPDYLVLGQVISSFSGASPVQLEVTISRPNTLVR